MCSRKWGGGGGGEAKIPDPQRRDGNSGMQRYIRGCSALHFPCVICCSEQTRPPSADAGRLLLNKREGKSCGGGTLF